MGGGSERASLCSGAGLGGRLNELERSARLLTAKMMIADLSGRGGAQTESDEALPDFHGLSKMAGEAVRAEVTVRLSIWRGSWSDGGTRDGRSALVQIDRVRARVLELGHGAWRHEMGMEDGDGERVLLRVHGPLSACQQLSARAS